MFAAMHSLYLAGQLNSQKGRAAKVKDGIVSEIEVLGTISDDRYNNIFCVFMLVQLKDIIAGAFSKHHIMIVIYLLKPVLKSLKSTQINVDFPTPL